MLLLATKIKDADRGWGVGVGKAQERALQLALVACRVPGFHSRTLVAGYNHP